ncbi:MAG: hypothetical protein R3321_00990 [Nitrososphaeraceae archaeon]|nr:hypothetical protein [Nitrososphaeraceae archaeon]
MSNIQKLTKQDLEVFDAVENSNMSKIEKSQVAKWIKSFSNSQPKISITDILVRDSISSLTGLILGAANAELKDGLDINNKPFDVGVGGLAGLIAWLTNSQVALTVSQSSFAIYSFRKTDRLLTLIKERAMSSKPADIDSEVSGEDPVESAGENL